MWNSKVNINSIEEKPAVLAKDIVYRHNGQKDKVLDGLSMTVLKSSMYGLTGCSGSGKTTLISCLLGVCPLESGDISLFGCSRKDSSRQNGLRIPGRDVGYMPQEISLYTKFTVQEILTFFGRLYHIAPHDLQHAIDKLLELTQLQNQRNSPIESLSGGQQRRVSFMISLVHSPKLLCLDEPAKFPHGVLSPISFWSYAWESQIMRKAEFTVGMDAVLRIRIWDHLRNLVKKGVTVIITTHYVEEMRKADRIGILENGKMKAENSPDNLLHISNSKSLTDAVLKIRKNPSMLRITNEAVKNHAETKSVVVVVQRKQCEEPVQSRNKFEDKAIQQPLSLLFKPSVVHALTWKSWTLLLRNVPFLLFLTISPAVQLLSTLFPCHPLTQVRLGVVNNELLHTAHSYHLNSTAAVSDCPNVTLSDDDGHCEMLLLSCVFINMISDSKLSLSYFLTNENAVTAVRNGETRGYISFSEIFSESLVSRAMTFNSPGMNLNMTILDGSHINTQLDQSNSISRYFILLELHRVQKEFLALLNTVCANNKESGTFPLQYKTPIFGDDGGINLSEYAGLGISLICILFYGLLSSGLNFQEERNSGMLNRLLMAGVKFREVVIAHYVAETVIILVQAILLFTLVYWWIPLHDFALFPFVFLFALNLLSGYVGMSLGFMLGTLLQKQVEIAMIGLAFILPNLFLSGTVWPLESMPELMQTIVKLLPSTLGTESLRWTWSRGFDIFHPSVWPAIASFFVYIVITNIIAMVVYKRKPYYL